LITGEKNTGYVQQTVQDARDALDNFIKWLYDGNTNNSQMQASPDELERSIDKNWYEDGESPTGGAEKSDSNKYIYDL